MATMANHDRETTQPTCQNCATSTTPLWRRDEMGAVLCNACGLFLKLHGRARPISLKTDVIKSRNRVKTVRPDLAKQKKQNQGLAATADANGADFANSARRSSQRSANGTGDDTNSPISRTGTPSMYGQSIHPVFGGLQGLEDQYQAQHLTNFGAGASPGRAGSPLNGDRLDANDLAQANATLKTRVSELEVIQELYRGRIQQLEQEDAARQQAREAAKTDEQLQAQIAALTEANSQLQKDLDESHHRENVLKRRLDELEVELKEAKSSVEAHESGRAVKRARVDDGPADANEEATALKPES